jgi:three-Cys-motif partner protein
MTIFSKNPRAQYFTPIYVDAFAGSGYCAIKQESRNKNMFPEFSEEETIRFLKGSARIALEISPPFSKYVFIEQDIGYQKELENLKKDFSSLASKIEILPGDANKHLKTLCEQTDWRKTRAVFFLDPYGMEVEWSTIRSIAETQSVDLWILFPLDVGVNRLLTKKHPPKDIWAKRLSLFFGTDSWKDEFYPRRTEPTLFGEKEVQQKEADWNKIEHYFIKRLKAIFVNVAINPLVLRNSKNVPIFLLCFAASNPYGTVAATAVRIAQHILESPNG